MNTQELFAVLIKAMGVFQFVVGVEMVPQYTSYLAANFPVHEILWALGFPGLKIVSGVILFLGANWLARRVYPEKPLAAA